MSTSTAKVKFEDLELGENPRQDQGDVDVLVSSIKDIGLCQPLIVEYLHYGGHGKVHPITGQKVFSRYIIRDGSRRYEAIRRIREKDGKAAFAEVPVVLYKGNEDDILFMQLAANVVRKDLNAVELSDAIRGMMNRKYAVDEIARRIGLSRSWILKLLKIRESCCASVLQALGRGQITLSAAGDLSALSEAKQLEALERYKLTRETSGTKAAKRQAEMDGERKIKPRQKDIEVLIGKIRVLTDDDFWRGARDALMHTTGDNEEFAHKADVAIVKKTREEQG